MEWGPDLIVSQLFTFQILLTAEEEKNVFIELLQLSSIKVLGFLGKAIHVTKYSEV